MHRVQVLERSDASIVEAAGEIDAFAAPDLASAFTAVAAASCVVVDLTRVSFLDSTALGAIVRGVREHAERGRATRVVLPRGSARRIFELTALDRALPLAASSEQALAELSGSD